MSTPIDVVTKEGITLLTLNRPEKYNAMNGILISQLLHLLKTIASDQHTRVVIIHGHGSHFCAGADIAWMQTVAGGRRTDNDEDAQMLADLMYELYHLPKPTIALAHGLTLGGGLGLIAASDMVIAAKGASFGFSEVKLGLAPSTISPYVIAAIGERYARYYFLTGERFGVEDAHRIGFIHQITEKDALLASGLTLAKAIMLNSPHALSAAKSLIHVVAHEKISTSLSRKTAKHLADLRTSSDAKEGLNAFLEKRPPKWC